MNGTNRLMDPNLLTLTIDSNGRDLNFKERRVPIVTERRTAIIFMYLPLESIVKVSQLGLIRYLRLR